MARSTLETVLMYGGGFILAYYILRSWGIIATAKQTTTTTTYGRLQNSNTCQNLWNAVGQICPATQAPTSPAPTVSPPSVTTPAPTSPTSPCASPEDPECGYGFYGQGMAYQNIAPLAEQNIYSAIEEPYNIKNIENVVRPRNVLYEDFDGRTGRGRMGQWGFVGDYENLSYNEKVSNIYKMK